MPRRYKRMKGLTYRAERALRKCLREKWDPLARGEEPETFWCELCIQYSPTDMSSQKNSYCLRCPVMARTGQRDCKGSPYREWENAYNDLGIASPQAIAAAKAERRFLRDTLRLGLAARERAKDGK